MNAAAVRRALRALIVASVTCSAGLVGAAAFTGSFGYLGTQILLTALGLLVFGILADISVGALGGAPRRARFGLVTLVASQTFYYLLVWTDWKLGRLLWGLWWLATVGCVTGAHLLALRATGKFRDDWIERATPWCAALAGILLATLALRPEAPPKLHPVFLVTWAVPALISAVGSWVLWRRRANQSGQPRPMARWARLSWLLATHALIFGAGFYTGGGGREAGSLLDLFPSALAGLTSEQVESQVRTDMDRLKTTVAGLEDLEIKAAALQAELRSKRRAELRDYYKPEEEERLRWLFATYLSYRAAHLRMVATYRGFTAVRKPEAQARCMMLGYAAAVTSYEYALRFVRMYLDEPAVRKKLNEPEEAWGIQADTFDRIYLSVTTKAHIEACYQMGAYYRHREREWRNGVIWSAAEFDWLHDRITRSFKYIETHPLSPTKRWMEEVAKRVKSDVKTPVFKIQTLLSEWIGDTRLVQHPPLISHDQIRELETKLRPGDILLERRNWYLSNAFLPGFWPHGALYVGRAEDLRRLGIADQPAVRDRLAAFQRTAHDGEPNTVIESVSEGVIFNSLTESMHADYVAVLRPRLSDKQIGEAIVRAFSHHGKPYDFEFDFFTADKLVCTELVYRAYEGLIHFDLVKVMGRDTLPAIEIVRKYMRERGTEKQELRFILFLEGDRPSGVAQFATESAFCASLDRPSVFTD